MRQRFLLDDSVIYLNHGAFGACPAEVFEQYQEWQRRLERNPMEFLARQSGKLLAASREALADFLGADAADLVYVPNATHGVNAVTHSLCFAAGDTIVTTDHEYGAIDNAWRIAAEAGGARVVTVPIPLPFQVEEFVDRVFAAVTPSTRLITTSHITSPTALIFPVAELCRRAREHGVLTLIDGAHAPGQIDLDLEAIGADFYVGNCHKWMCAPKGAAFLHVRPEHQEQIHGTVISWGYSARIDQHAGIDQITGTTVLERRLQWQGTRDIAAFLTVPAAIAFLAAHDRRALNRRCHAMAWDCAQRVAALTGLGPIGRPDDVAQMVALPIATDDPEALRATLLERYRIEVPVTTLAARHFVRLSVFAYNTEADLDALVGAIDELRGCPELPPGGVLRSAQVESGP